MKISLKGLGGAIGTVAGTALGGPLGGGIGGILGTGIDNAQMEQDAAAAQAHQDYMQTLFAQNSLSWKVADGKKVGLSPLASIGASGTSYSPTQAGDVGSSMANMGQNLLRAWDAVATQEQREMADLQKQSLLEDIQGKRTDNEIRNMEAEVLRRRANNPPVPSGSTVDRTKSTPVEVNHLRGYYKSAPGGYGTVLSSDLKSAIEDTPREWLVDVRDMANQQINPQSERYLKQLPPPRKGMHYEFNYPTQEYIEMPNKQSIWERIGRHSSYMWR